MTWKAQTFVALSLVTVLLAGDVTQVLAQRAAPMELSLTYGSMWGGHVGLRGGKLRTGTGGSFGVAFDYPIGPGTWLEASYTRQDGSLDWDAIGQPKRTLTDMSANFWQIGTIQALSHPGQPFVPFLQGSLGATYLSPSNSQVILDDETLTIDSITKFSITFGAGFKYYFGQAQKVGIRGSFKVLSTLFDSGGGLFFGPGGVSLGVSGSGIWQYEVAGGLTVRFGG